MERVFTTAYSAFIHSSCYFGTVQRTRGVERLCSATERGEVLLSYPIIFTRGKPRKAYECASRRRIPTQSAPTAREYQPVGVGAAPRALFALGVVRPPSYFVRGWQSSQNKLAVSMTRRGPEQAFADPWGLCFGYKKCFFASLACSASTRVSAVGLSEVTRAEAKAPCYAP
ncbi:hypothetical protein NE237_017121 [Protea cynaroides]|uniref:Uncharacterized protein n=1 Tax=Protea cynaroides TaxID=273540 RepID=A0A9Q0K7F5_9MAGN|nr:hypothetical protein NE237_017121 [Protea cynaroides]